MNKTMFTGLDKNSYEAGLAWIDKFKQSNFIVIDMGLDQDQIDKLKEFNVKIVSNINKVKIPQVDLFNSFLSIDGLDPCGVYVYCNVEKIKETDDICNVSHLAATVLSNYNIATLVLPLVNIDNRVKIGKQLNNKPIYSSDFIVGKLIGWQIFIGLYSALIEMGIIEIVSSTLDFVLNLFALHFPNYIQKIEG